MLCHASAHNSAGIISLPDAIISRISNQLVWALEIVMESRLIGYLCLTAFGKRHATHYPFYDQYLLYSSEPGNFVDIEHAHFQLQRS